MLCGACAARVENVAMTIEGVTAATMRYSTGTAEITYDPARTSPDAIAKTMTAKTGFKTDVPRQDQQKD